MGMVFLTVSQLFPSFYSPFRIILMIIRYCTTKTLKASPFSNRGVRRTPGGTQASKTTLKGSPITLLGDPFRVDALWPVLSGGTSHPRLLKGDAFSVLLVVHLRIII